MSNQLTTQNNATVITHYEALQEQIAIAKQQDAAAKFDYHDKKQNKEARSHVASLRKVKARIEKARKEAKAYALDYGRRVDAQAKEMESEIVALIEPHAFAIDQIEQAERDRIAKHQSVLDRIKNAVTAQYDHSSTAQDALNDIQAIDTTTMEEFAQPGADAQSFAIESLKVIVAKLQKSEHDAAELARLQKEAAERAEQERIEAAKREAAEQARKEAEAKAERDRLAAEAEAKRIEEQRKLEAERAERAAQEREELLKQQAEQQRLAAEKAEADRIAAEQRAADMEKREQERIKAEKKAEQDHIKAEKKRADELKAKRDEMISDMVESITDEIGVHLHQEAKRITTAIINGNIPYVTCEINP